jgi:hypothetical protein
MPALMANYQEKETVTKLKKVYNSLSNAYNLAMEEEGGPLTAWEGYSKASGGELPFAEKMLKHMQVSKYCGHSKGCFPDIMYVSVKGANYNNWENMSDRAKAILADGTSIMFNISAASSGTDAQIYVDVNGFKPPNQLGKDFFYFHIKDSRVFPHGAPEVSATNFKTLCVNAGATGTGCAAWVIFNENMDYLHCDDLSWNGKTKCD